MSKVQIVLKSSDKPHYVYLIRSTNANRTYVGYAVDPFHRLRKHNGELVGGAKATRIGRPWKLVCILSGFPDKKTALQLEWRLHHPTGRPTKRRRRRKRVNALDERLKSVQKVLKLERWTNSCHPSNMIRLQLQWIEPGHIIRLNVPWVNII